MRIEEGVELSRLTTIGTGGPARAFARPETVVELEEALCWAAERDLPVAPVGLGSNLLAADEGVEMLVLRLAGELAAVGVDPPRVRAGGGASLRRLPAPCAGGGARASRVRLRNPWDRRRRRVDERRGIWR